MVHISQYHNYPMKISSCRMSTDDQNPDVQLAALQQAGCRKIGTDQASGAHVKRPEMIQCLKAWGGKRGSPTRHPLLPRNAGTAEPFRGSPPEAVAYPLECVDAQIVC